MTIIQLTPGAGPMFCGNCLRDNALVAALRKMGHQVLMVPLYLPLTLDEDDQSAGVPIFYNGINVYLAQKSAWFRGAPGWFRDLFASRRVLQWAAGKAAKTRAEDLGDVALSMLRGEAGHQARELEELVSWLKTQPRPDMIYLSNALLVGFVRRMKSELGAPVACALQGEDCFLDVLPETHREACWNTLAERAAEVDLFVAPSRYFGDVMRKRLRIPAERVRVVHNGINLAGYERAEPVAQTGHEGERPVTLGFFARMCREKGLDTLVEAYIELRHRRKVKNLKLRIGGSCGPADQLLVDSLRQRLLDQGFLGDVSFHPNLPRSEKQKFLRSLDVFSVPALYGEAFGLYVVEALAAGVPVVQPRTGSFPELIDATGGGLLCAPGEPKAFADAIESLLLHPEVAKALALTGQRAVFENFSAEAMAQNTLQVFRNLATTRRVESLARQI